MLANLQKTDSEIIKYIFLIATFLFVISCRSAEIKDKESITIREKIINNSFDIGGFARQDSIKRELYFWDTIIKKYDKIDTIKTSFNDITKFQTLQIKTRTDTLRDTIYIKSGTKIEYKDVIKYKEVVPSWVWWCLFIAILEFIFIIMCMKIRK